MTNGDSGHFDQAHLQRWWQATLVYLQAAPSSACGAVDHAGGTRPEIPFDERSDRVDAGSPSRASARLDSVRLAGRSR